jgi:N-methylhydantoinase A
MAETTMTELRIAIDIGGTFTDVSAYDVVTGEYRTAKTPSTPGDLAAGVLDALGSIAPDLAEVASCVHGTTVGLNAFLQRSGERVMILATRGARDVYHIARGNRLDMYDIRFRKPTPLVPRRDILEVGGRLDHRGTELEPLDQADLASAVEHIRSEGVTSVAVAFLFSYIEPVHERAAAAYLREALPGLSVTLSHEVAPEWREYERTSTAVLNAYIAPAVGSYLTSLVSQLRLAGLDVPLRVMQSNGGIARADHAAERPIHTLLSGPVGGTAGGVGLAEVLDRPDLICIDMGGTSFDVSLVAGAEPHSSPDAYLEGLPVLMPIVDIHTIGAGGGSIARVEAGGLRVGPQSAGADPGPAAYGRGGSEPTVTDANLFLGRIDPDRFLGGKMKLDPALAEAALARVGAQLDLTATSLAAGVLDVINARMAQAIRTITVQKGVEPRGFSVVAFGGAGPLHAADVAEELGVTEVIVPPDPGAFSAWGMLQTDVRQDFSRPFFRVLVEVDDDMLRRHFSELERHADDALDSEGIGKEKRNIRYAADLRYTGQEHTLVVPLDLDLRSDGVSEAASRFHTMYESRYGHSNPAAPLEFVNLRLTALGHVGRPLLTDREAPSRETVIHERPVELTFGQTSFQAARIDRAGLPVGFEREGPVIIDEPTATTVVPPRWGISVNSVGCLILTMSAA